MTAGTQKGGKVTYEKQPVIWQPEYFVVKESVVTSLCLHIAPITA